MRPYKTILPKPVDHDDGQDFAQRVGSVDVDFDADGCQLRLLCKFLWYGRDIRERRMEFAHSMPPFSRVFLFQRAGGEYYADGRRHELIPGTIYLLPSGQPFEIAYHPGSELLYCHVHVCDETMTPAFTGTKGLPSVEDAELAGRMMRSWHSGDRLAFQLAEAEAVARFAAPLREAMRSRRMQTRKFGRLFEIMQQTPPGRLRVEELADAMGMTRAALSKSFARGMGLPLKRYILELQLKKACELLLFSDLSVAELSARLGHEDPHYFHRLFKRLTGSTPDAYRKSNGKGS